MTGQLTTHVLDTANGRPAVGMAIDVVFDPGDSPRVLKQVTTNSDGRTDQPLLEGSALKEGAYRLVFHVADYFRGQQHPGAGKFLDQVPVAFHVEDATYRYHVPLLVSPWSYATYRGS